MRTDISPTAAETPALDSFDSLAQREAARRRLATWLSDAIDPDDEGDAAALDAARVLGILK